MACTLVMTVLLVSCGREKIDSNNDSIVAVTSIQPEGNPQVILDSKPAMTNYVLRHTAYYSGSCDGSGGVALDEEHFAVVNDETSLLLIYRRHEPGAPIQTINIRRALELKKKEEGDLEGLARIGDLLYVLGSHSRDRDGKKQKERRKLLALRIISTSEKFELKPVGDVYEDLMDDLEDHNPFQSLNLKDSAKESGDDPEGFNIEGLCSSSDGIMWLCFRGPRISGKALLIPINNPRDVIFGARAKFGSHVLLDLQGRTIRGADQYEGQIILVADSDSDGLGSALFLWNGVGDVATQLHTPDLHSMDPESLILFPDTGLQELLILSDDGGRRLLGKDCKDWEDASSKRFRSVTYQWQNH